MKYRQLGKTELVVSEIGFGTWGLGGNMQDSIGYGPVDDEESKKALQRAFDLGVTFYDTSDLYGFGHSERILGSVFRAKRKNVILATKVGFVKKNGNLVQDFSVTHINDSLEKSLKRLQTDYIDLYQLHSPPLELLEKNPEILNTFYQFKKAGKVRAVGISVRSPEDALIVVRERWFPCIQVNFSLIDQRIIENDCMDLCMREGIGLIGRTPLCYGFLTGHYSAETKFDSHDHRSNWPVQQLEVWSNAAAVFSPLLQCQNQTPAQLALRFCLSYPAISTVIPGMLKNDHVDENALASSLGPYSETTRLNLEELYKKHTFFLKQEKK